MADEVGVALVGAGFMGEIHAAALGKDPRARLRCVVDRGTQNATVDGIVALQYEANKEPVTQDATTVGGQEFHHAPAEGTA